AAMPGEVPIDDLDRITTVMDTVASHLDVDWLTSRLDTELEPRLSPPAFRYMLVERARRADKRIVLPEGEEPRTVQAAARCVERGIARCVLLGEEDAIRRVAEAQGVALPAGIEIVEPGSVRDAYHEPKLHQPPHPGQTEPVPRDPLEDNDEHATKMLARGEVDGLVSGAVHTTAETALGGCDLEMPGPARHLGPQLAKAVEAGEVPQAVLDDMARRILRVMARSGALAKVEEAPERAEDRPAHRALIRETACAGAVLLRNEGDVLPLPHDLRRLVLIGPNARETCIQGGGSARVLAHREVSVLDALRERADGRFELVFEPGCTSHRSVPLLRAADVTPPGGEGRGLRMRLFPSFDLSGEPVHERVTRGFEQVWMGSPARGVPARFSARLEGRVTAREGGVHTFALTTAGRARLFLDDVLAIDLWEETERGEAFFGLGSVERTAELPLEAGDEVAVRVEYSKEGAPFLGGLRLGHLPPFPDDAMERAEAAARDADAAVVVIGLNRDWETEGRDRESLALPGRQAELAERVAAANPRTVVVVNAGAPVDLAFAERVPALLWAWYPGQEAGHAVADLLFGDAEPGGRLPTTFPARLEDTPSFPHYPGSDGKVLYGEGVLAGYRHYDTRGVTPRFPFGHGLSYTRFELSDLVLSRDEAAEPELPVEASVTLRNVGARKGSEVVQLYVHDREASVPRPEQELRAFARVELAPGERRRVRLPLPARAFAFWDETRRAWTAEAGDYEIRVGRSSRDLPLRAGFRLRRG
ncbi:MAG: phosphate acyltransferase, partial [Myxococcota bacterium]|nr:phosphate acyltransferase [Myxococcota bacterium]